MLTQKQLLLFSLLGLVLEIYGARILYINSESPSKTFDLKTAIGGKVQMQHTDECMLSKTTEYNRLKRKGFRFVLAGFFIQFIYTVLCFII